MLGCILAIIFSPNTMDVFQSSLFIQSLVNITILIIFLSILFVCGAQVNEELDLHR